MSAELEKNANNGALAAIGTVLSVDNGRASVVFARSKACGDCTACASFGNGMQRVELENSLGAAEGDRVLIELHAGRVMKASLIMYGVPLAALIAGVLLGSRFGDLYAALGGIALSALALASIRLFEPRIKKRGSFEPRMVRFLDTGGTE